jgi:hypothetical protein
LGATDTIAPQWRFAARLVETSPEILNNAVDNGPDIAVLFLFAPKRAGL